MEINSMLGLPHVGYLESNFLSYSGAVLIMCSISSLTFNYRSQKGRGGGVSFLFSPSSWQSAGRHVTRGWQTAPSQLRL